MENERRFAIKSVKKLEGDYQKYSAGKALTTKVATANVIAAAAACIATVTLKVGFDYSCPEITMFSNINMLITTTNFAIMSGIVSKLNKTGTNLNEAYDELNISEEERIIDDEGRSK